MKCVDCNKEGSERSIRSHMWKMHTPEGLAHHSTRGKKRKIPVWNKGLSKDTDDRIRRSGLTLSENYANGTAKKSFLGKHHSVETRQKIGEKLTGNNHGGRCQWYEVSGVKVQGTWEKNVAEKLNTLQIPWLKLRAHKDLLKYEMNGKKRNYTPDFYLPTFDVYLEVKGFWWGDDELKMDAVKKQHPHKRIVVMTKDLYHRFLDGELVW